MNTTIQMSGTCEVLFLDDLSSEGGDSRLWISSAVDSSRRQTTTIQGKNDGWVESCNVRVGNWLVRTA